MDALHRRGSLRQSQRVLRVAGRQADQRRRRPQRDHGAQDPPPRDRGRHQVGAGRDEEHEEARV